MWHILFAYLSLIGSNRCCFYLAEKVEDLDKAVGLELW